ncbi:hypothetical protein Tco_1027793 [Tanacetum coccineum]
MKEMRDGCKKCGGPHPSSECDEKPMGGSEEEANYSYRGYRGRGYRGNYYGRNFGNWHDRQPSDDNRHSQPREGDRSTPLIPEKKLGESDFKKTMREFMVAQRSLNEFVRNKFFNLKTKVEQGQKNHQAAIQGLETNGKTYNPPVNPNDKNSIIHDDSDDKSDEAEIEEEPINIPLIDVLPGMPNYEKFLKDLVNNKSKMEQISAAFLNEE